MPMNFALQIAKYAESQKGDVGKVVRTAVLEIASRLIEASPVGDAVTWKDPASAPPGYVGGAFKGAWCAAVGEAPGEHFQTIDPTGQVSIDRIAVAIPEDVAGTVCYIANNMPYAIRLEEGWSAQAPLGMVGLTVMDWQTIMANSVQKVKEGGE